MTTADTDCSICFQRYVHPVELPCGHIFCFLCIKGCALRRRRCPMCRARFSMRSLEDPKLVQIPKAPEPSGSSVTSTETPPGGPSVTPNVALSVPVTPTEPPSTDYCWFYEGFAGWWQYDERTSEELEAAFSKQSPSCEVQVAGYIYTIDFVHMTQKRKDNSGRKRRIKRDLRCSAKKGIAGIRLSVMETNVTDTNNGASSSVPEPQSTQPSVELVQETSTVSASPDIENHIEEIAHETSRLSLPHGSLRTLCTRTSACLAPPDLTETRPLPTERSRPATRGYRNPSLTRPSPSPDPAPLSAHHSNAPSGDSRLPGSRISRSVPRH